MNRRLVPLVYSMVIAVLVGAGAAGLSKVAAPLPASGMSLAPVAPLVQVGSGFTYQGRLTDSNGVPASGQYDFVFKLFDAAFAGNQVGPSLALTNQTVTGGIFTVSLDFGNTAFLGDARWLEIATAVAGNPPVTLSPRTPLAPSPYALSAPWTGTSDKPTLYNQLLTANRFNTVDATNNVGSYPSVTIGSDGLPLISYQDTTNLNLRVAHCGDLDCTTSTQTAIDSTGSVGYFSSITVGADGLGLISYYDGTNNHLKVAHCSNVACTAATLSTIDSNPLAGEYTSIAINRLGFGVISYYEQTNDDLKFAACANINCTSATLRTLDSTGDVGRYTSITISSNGQLTNAQGVPVISYQDSTNTALKVAACIDDTCSSATLTTLDSTNNVGLDTSIALGRDGLPIISYEDGSNSDLKLVHCGTPTCSQGTPVTIDSTGIVGAHSSVAIGSDGLPIISYYDSTNQNLKVAHCTSLACSSANLVTVASGGSVGLFSALAMGIDGLPFIAYQDNANSFLLAAHCGSLLCVSNLRNGR